MIRRFPSAVEGMLKKDGDVRRFSRMAVTVASLSDGSGTLQLTWYNMPYLRTMLKAGSRYIFRGRVVKKNGHMIMEQPEIFSLAAYEARAGSMQPIYGQTKGLGNKTIAKAVAQALEGRGMEREYLPEDIRTRYELA